MFIPGTGILEGFCEGLFLGLGPLLLVEFSSGTQHMPSNLELALIGLTCFLVLDVPFHFFIIANFAHMAS